MHKLATLQELARLLGPQIRGTTRGPPQSHLRSQRGMLSRYGWKLRWDLDNSYSTDFALEALNHTYPGCTGVYLDRGGHMLAFYGLKGSSKAGLIQEVAIEAGHAVTKIPTWMGLTTRWEVKCVSLTEANDILAGCRRLEQENRRREHQYYQDRLASWHQPSGLSATAAPFQPQAAPPPRSAEMASDQHKPEE